MTDNQKISNIAIVGITLVSSVMGAVAVICEVMAGSAAGLWYMGAHAAIPAGAAAMGSVGGLFLAGAAGGTAFAIKKSGGGNIASATAAFALSAMTIGAGVAGFEIGKSLQEANNKQINIAVGEEAKKAYDTHPDKSRVASEINDMVLKKLARENRESFNLCVANKDRFKAKGTDCAIFAPPAPAP